PAAPCPPACCADAYDSITLLIIFTNSPSEVRPTTVLRGVSPPLKMKTRGMLTMPYFVATSGASSTFSLPTFTLPANWVAMRSMVGLSWRQGPHQGAQKSTRTGWSLCSTSFCQLSLVNSTTFGLAMVLTFLACEVRPPERRALRPAADFPAHYRAGAGRQQ